MSTDRETLWYWVREREQIRVRKELGYERPWTADPILGTYRFCNVRREDDRVTRWIDEHVRRPFADHPWLWFMLCICRQLNWPDTLAELIATPGAWPSHEDFSPLHLLDALRERKDRGDKVYTGAYIITAPPDPGVSKHAYIATLVLGALWRTRHEMAGLLADSPTMRQAHAWISASQGWGHFTAYQAVVDMRFTRVLGSAPDVATWAAAGPGTIRGLNRLHGRPLGRQTSQRQALCEMLDVFGLVERETGVVVDLSDVPNIFCEFDKYLRARRGEGRPKTLYVAGRGS